MMVFSPYLGTSNPKKYGSGMYPGAGIAVGGQQGNLQSISQGIGKQGGQSYLASQPKPFKPPRPKHPRFVQSNTYGHGVPMPPSAQGPGKAYHGPTDFGVPLPGAKPGPRTYLPPGWTLGDFYGTPIERRPVMMPDGSWKYPNGNPLSGSSAIPIPVPEKPGGPGKTGVGPFDFGITGVGTNTGPHPQKPAAPTLDQFAGYRDSTYDKEQLALQAQMNEALAPLIAQLARLDYRNPEYGGKTMYEMLRDSGQGAFLGGMSDARREFASRGALRSGMSDRALADLTNQWAQDQTNLDQQYGTFAHTQLNTQKQGLMNDYNKSLVPIADEAANRAYQAALAKWNALYNKPLPGVET